MARSGRKTSEKAAPISRREEVRRTIAKDRYDWHSILDRPSVFLCFAIGLFFVACVSMIIFWAQSQPMAREGQIMLDTFAARIDFDIIDNEATRTAREAAADTAPAVYRAIEGRVNALSAPLYGLPKVVAGKQVPADLPPDLVDRLKITGETIAALQKYLDASAEPTAEWKSMVDRFVSDRLLRNPLITADQWAREQLAPPAGAVDLHFMRDGEDTIISIQRADLVNTDGDGIADRVAEMVRVFPVDLRKSIEASLMFELSPTFQYDDQATAANRRAAEAAIPSQKVRYVKGTVIYTAGSKLAPAQLIQLKAEHAQFNRKAQPRLLWLQRLGVVGLVLIITSVMVGCIGIFRPDLFHKTLRLFVLAAIMVAMLAETVAMTSVLPGVFLGIVLTSTLLVAVILVVAYGRAVALGLGCLFGLLACISLPIPIGYLALVIGSLGLNVWQLQEIRDRNRLLRAGAVTGFGAALGGVILSILYRPVTTEGFALALFVDLLGGAASGLFVGIFMLGILSSIERLFNVTTGLTLVELRDPKQTLLRQLLQRAPGTWNHSLQVANIAESAAEVINADSLLTYVGALYHDIGKMNKPAYFVENQTDGENRHARLSPAMSLLIIVGHVKDGIEMAREFGLPKALHHFIEAHHGTTLVEYFYHVAREKAEAGQTNDDVQEIEYRYPGPKPQTKEAAILMIADAVESASRAMPEKSPTRIEQLVRAIGQKRLLDGQFDECDLTLRELHQVEDSIIKSLNAMHHARVSYPSDAKPDENAAAPHSTSRAETKITA